MKPSDDALAKALVDLRPGPGACPDANLLVGWAEGRLDDERRRDVEEHLAACDTCREQALVLREELAPVAAAPPARLPFPLRLLRGPLAIAALALLAIGVGVFVLARRDIAPWGTAPQDPETRFLAEAAKLRAEEPALLADLAPPSSRDLVGAPDRTQRGGVLLTGLPARFLEPIRPTFTWEAVAGVESWRVRLLDARGSAVWTASATEARLPWPADAAPLAPGASYVLEVKGDAPLGAVEGRRGFEVASEREAAHFRAARARIQQRSPAFASRLTAHLALARGFTLEARVAADAALAANPKEPGAQRLRAHVAALLAIP
jgi:hypothetical protein